MIQSQQIKNPVVRNRISRTTIALILWYLATMANGARCEAPTGVEYEIILDSKKVKFADLIFGFIRIRNTSGREAYLPSLARFAHHTEIQLRCEGQVADASLVPNFAIVARKQPAGYSSVAIFCIRYLEPKMVLRIREGFPCHIRASTPVRPAEIGEKLFQHSAGYDNRGKSGEVVPLSEYRFNEGNHILTATAEVAVEIDLDDWIFKRKNEPLIRIAARPPAWRGATVIRSITRGMSQMRRSKNPGKNERHSLELSAIDSIPILSVFPDRVFTIQSRLDQDTTTWRYLELQRLLRLSTFDPFDGNDLSQVLDRAWHVLACCGPAELIANESYFTSSME